MTCIAFVENKYWTEKDDYVQNRWQATTSKEVFFYCKHNSSLSLDICLSSKALKHLWKNMYLILDLLHYKLNPLVTTVADDIIYFERKTLEDIFTQVLQWWNHN